MRRNPPNREYPPNTHKVERTARPGQIVQLITKQVAADGGRATFLGFGRWAKRLLEKAQALLPPEYGSMLIEPESIGTQPGQPTWRERRHEWRLVVTVGDGPEPPAVPHYPD